MPTYDYRCRKCGHVFELFHSIRDEKPRRCPRCKGKAQRVPSGGAGLLFKGSGFYITDYRSREYKEQAKREKGGGSPAGGDKKSGGDAKSGGETKPGGGSKASSGAGSGARRS
jgi:putative FmdB family regulatory protein